MNKETNNTTEMRAILRKVLGGTLTVGMLGGLALSASAAAPRNNDRGGQRGSQDRGRTVTPERGRNVTPDRGRNFTPPPENRGRVDRGHGDQGRGIFGNDRDRDHGDRDRDFDHDRFVVRTYVPYASFTAPIDVGAIAQQNGYRDGFAAGQYDAYHGFRSDCDDNPEFRSGMAGFVVTYGDSGFYQRNYRIGFERGYNDGLASVR